jgi:hypothetical protein
LPFYFIEKAKLPKRNLDRLGGHWLGNGPEWIRFGVGFGFGCVNLWYHLKWLVLELTRLTPDTLFLGNIFLSKNVRITFTISTRKI